ncbi:MAG: argininosuccinate lyase [Oscillospiraceae bacterium]|nr:argininosuccinate lyase [Oscillospiraceae bacterium]
MKLWGGRFTKNTDGLADHFHSSISFDKRLMNDDIEGSIAHARMLSKQDIITKEDAQLIQDTLKEILNDINSGKLKIDEHAEDIHTNVEKLLIERIGEVGKKLHTGRSRNDQVALDMRMYVKNEINSIKLLVIDLMSVLVDLSSKNLDTYMPGYTHLQRAQPVTLAHHLCAYFEMFRRDLGRLTDCYSRTDDMPLGSGALAATTYPLDRQYVAKELGFSSITLNSMDAVSDRDFCLEFLSSLSIMMMHLSRFCEEIILWSSYEFQFIELDDAYATGSSIMPQKKNPDMAELIRGKTGRVYGDLIGLLTVMKGLPLAYNKDLQEDKEAVFDAVDTVKMCLPVFSAMIKSMNIKNVNMRRASSGGFTNATDAADWLVKKGIAFRDAHEIIGKLVLECVSRGISLEDLTMDEFKRFSPVFDESIYHAISIETCVEARSIIGGPSKAYISGLIKEYEQFLGEIKK